MSDASRVLNPAPSRPLREEERDLVRSLLFGSPASTQLENLLLVSRVTDMHDGEMGSMRFLQLERRPFGKALAEAQYVDSDGVLVSITLNADDDGQLFELDFWKVDFSPLRRYPKPSDLVVKR